MALFQKHMRNKHRPPHLLLNNQTYFFSLRTIDGVPILFNPERKYLAKNILDYAVKKYGFELIAWVILQNHIHFIVEVSNALTIPKFVNLLSGKSTIELNKLDRTSGRKIWYQYWDHCIRDEKALYVHINYIHQNPVKHDIVERIEEYELSSYRDFIRRYGSGWIAECFEKYPIIDFNPRWE